LNTTHDFARHAARKAGRGSGDAVFANWIVTTFLAAQLLDGALTYVGVVTGTATERNPLLAWYIAAFGIGPALTGAKLFAGGCAASLHLAGAHRSLAALTASYLLLAVAPWVHLLFLR